MGEGREGDWECGSCHNRNYAFRSFCNRCKQPRLLVDTKTPADSKWLPRIGDWICSGCTNNNYASREKCKKCGQPKEVAAMPAIAMPGASLPTHAHYFARPNEGFGLNINMGMPSNPGLQQSLSSGSRWPYGGTEKHGLQPASVWPSGGSNSSGYPSSVNPNQHVMAPKDWRNGDWLCNCGFHNYSSRTQCMKCNASIPVGGPPSMSNPAVPDLFPSLGTKRLAPDEFVNDWDSKRLNAGDNQFLAHGQQLPYQGQQQMLGSSNDQAQGQQFPYQGHQQMMGSSQQMMGSSNEQAQGMYGFQQTSISAPGVSSGSVPMAPQFHLTVQSPQVALMPTLLGKGAKQWRDGDWMCTNCSNHNFASRLQCNRCNGQKNASTHPLSVA